MPFNSNFYTHSPPRYTAPYLCDYDPFSIYIPVWRLSEG